MTRNLTHGEQRILLFSVFFLSMCGIIYELVLGSLATYLLGNPVQQYSVTIGVFLSSMGAGSYLSRYLGGNLVALFARIEALLGFVGGISVVALTLLFSFSPWFYALHVFFLIVIGSLVGLEIPIVTRILKKYGSLKEIISNVLSLDYLGGLAGSLLFPLVLFPFMGRFMTSIIVGLLNILVALVIVVRLQDTARRRADLFFPVAAFGLLVFLAFQSPAVTAFMQKKIYQDDVIFQKKTRYQEIVLTRSGADFRLYLDGALQFSTTDEYRYHEMLVHPAMMKAGIVRDALVLGGGDGLALRELLKYPGLERITLVELDGEMVNLATGNSTMSMINQSALTDKRVTVVVDDAYRFIRETKGRYDIIIADFPDPHDETVAKLYSLEFFTLVKKILREGGVFITQSTSPLFAREAFWSINRTMKQVFLRVVPYHIYIPTFGDWGFNLAQVRERVKPMNTPPGLKYYSSVIYERSRHFGADEDEIDVPINSFNNPVLYQLYLKGWKNQAE